MANGFKKASRSNKFLRMSIQGASGSGKTRSALEIAKHLCPPGKRIALIDTEKSAGLYSDVVDFDVDDDFGPFGKISYHPDVWLKKIQSAAAAGEYGVLILDSFTHFWKGEDGLLAMIDKITTAARARGQKGDSFAAWKSIDPIWAKFMNSLRTLPMHVILCIRAKQAYEKVTETSGKGNIRKLGMEPEMRDGFEFELDLQTAIDTEHVLVPLKHRLDTYMDGKVFTKPGKEFADSCLEWLAAGAPGQDLPTQTLPTQTLPTQTLPTQTPTVVDELSPETERQEAGAPTVAEKLVAQIEAANTVGDLKAVGLSIKEALDNKLITQDERNGVLTRTFSERQKALKGSVAA